MGAWRSRRGDGAGEPVRQIQVDPSPKLVPVEREDDRAVIAFRDRRQSRPDRADRHRRQRDRTDVDRSDCCWRKGDDRDRGRRLSGRRRRHRRRTHRRGTRGRRPRALGCGCRDLTCGRSSATATATATAGPRAGSTVAACAAGCGAGAARRAHGPGQGRGRCRRRCDSHAFGCTIDATQHGAEGGLVGQRDSVVLVRFDVDVGDRSRHAVGVRRRARRREQHDQADEEPAREHGKPGPRAAAGAGFVAADGCDVR